METSIFLSNREVVAAEGIRRSGAVTVYRIVRGLAPENSIINGIVTDELEFDRFFRRFWEEHGLAKDRVVLVLGNAQAAMRNLRLPPMTHNQRMHHLMYEFADVARRKPMVLSYVKMGTDGRSEMILAGMTEQEFLEKHIRRFKEMGIRLQSVVLAEAADILALHQVADIREKNCVVQVPDGVSMLNILYRNGHYIQMNRTRILSMPGTGSYAAECAELVSRMCLFAEEYMPQCPVTHVYLAGGFREEEYAVYRHKIRQTTNVLTVEPLKMRLMEQIRFAAEDCCQDFSRSIAAIGGLLAAGRRNNLLYQYRLCLETVKRRKHRFRCLRRWMVVIGIPCVIAAGQWAMLDGIRERVEWQQEYMECAEEFQLARLYEEQRQEMDAMQIETQEMRRLSDELRSFPSYTAEAVRVITECEQGETEVEIKGYYGFDLNDFLELEKKRYRRNHENCGVLYLEVFCGAPEQIHQFVERLEKKTEIVDAAEYNGFVRNEKRGGWTAKVSLRLAGQGGNVWK